MPTTVARRRKDLNLQASGATTRLLSSVVKHQLVLDELAQDPLNHWEPRTVREGIVATSGIGGVDLNRFVDTGYDVHAQAVFDSLDFTALTLQNVWAVFSAMLLLMDEAVGRRVAAEFREEREVAELLLLNEIFDNDPIIDLEPIKKEEEVEPKLEFEDLVHPPYLQVPKEEVDPNDLPDFEEFPREPTPPIIQAHLALRRLHFPQEFGLRRSERIRAKPYGKKYPK
ncbi:hypothetical protein BU15DRAFT_77016 [Melanogaster broomeanus]|nr:hypothetical protein BU15DRAFT_77016 [Melanogaster broomeanus]